MHIGLLGAAFDPPHIGHLLIAQQTLDFAGLDEVWFLPTFGHTFAKQTVPAIHRVAMCKKLLLGETKMRVSTLEIDHKLDGNTINLVPLLKQKYPKDRFTFIIGSDNLPTFHKWGNWELLLTKLPFLVFPRAGFPLEPIYEGMKVLKHPLLVVTNISSTVVRTRLAQNLNVNHFVTPEINVYIKQHKLYQ